MTDPRPGTSTASTPSPGDKIVGITPRSSSGVIASVSASLVARLLTFPLSALGTFLFSALVIRSEGAQTFALVMTVGTLILFLPFADLGLGAAVINIVAEAEAKSMLRQAAKPIIRVVLLLCLPGLCIVVVAWAFTLTGLWPELLGFGDSQSESVNSATATMLSLFALAIPLGVGQRVLTGLGCNHWGIVISAVASPVTLGFGWLCIVSKTPGPFLALGPTLGLLVANIIACLAAAKVWRKFLSFSAITVQDAPEVGYRRMFGDGIPMAVINVGNPIAFQSQRIVVSHLSNTQQLAQYSLAMQLYASALSFITVAATSLWPIFARDRGDKASATMAYRRSSLIFGILAVIAVAGFATVSSPIASLISGGDVDIGLPLAISSGLLIAAQTLRQSSSMMLSDAAGLRLQAYSMTVTAMLSLGVSVVLVPHFGATGATWAMTFAVLFGQTIPTLLWGRRRLR